jgi:hypothetical protein
MPNLALLDHGDSSAECSRGHANAGQGRLPKLHFPTFSGDDPQLWRSRYEIYFDMYGVESSQWIKVATMHFEGVVACRLQSMERQLRKADWEEFCVWVHDRFGRDQHESLIRQLFHIRQKGSVSKYVEQFSSLVDQLAAYEEESNPLYYAMRFVDGLQNDIRSVVMIQQPSTLDEACALALVQEEAANSVKRREVRHYDLFSNKQGHKSAYSSLPPPKYDKPPPNSAHDEKKGTEEVRVLILMIICVH